MVKDESTGIFTATHFAWIFVDTCRWHQQIFHLMFLIMHTCNDQLQFVINISPQICASPFALCTLSICNNDIMWRMHLQNTQSYTYSYSTLQILTVKGFWMVRSSHIAWRVVKGFRLPYLSRASVHHMCLVWFLFSEAIFSSAQSKCQCLKYSACAEDKWLICSAKKWRPVSLRSETKPWSDSILRSKKKN